MNHVSVNDDPRLQELQHLLASGGILPSQMARRSDWSPEKKLAAAVFANALVEVRDRHADTAYQRRVREDVEWIFSEEVVWPFSFVRLCHLFDLEPEYVRAVVRRWLAAPAPRAYRQCSAHRHAA
jgi:hypothetical protein